jgi:pSer/pThr/pTyr-binding forkhead associated (FHA) protein
MAKIIVTFNGLIQQEMTLNKPRITIGRRPTNDLVIDHLTISGQHAAIDSAPQGSFILDLGSTNGTMVNGQPIKKHLLQHDDVIDIGKYKIRYQADSVQQQPNRPMAPATEAAPVAHARIKVLNGASSGKELLLTKTITTLGSPSVQVAAITRQEQHYFIAHIEGEQTPKINDVAIGTQTRQLQNGDVIDLSGTRMMFTFGAE